jgi:hypothetical protein
MICRIVVSAFVLAYAVALVALVVGVFGLFGAERDPLAAVFLVPLGMPWTSWWADCRTRCARSPRR